MQQAYQLSGVGDAMARMFVQKKAYRLINWEKPKEKVTGPKIRKLKSPLLL